MEKITENDTWRYNRAWCNAAGPQTKNVFWAARTLRAVGLRARSPYWGAVFDPPIVRGREGCRPDRGANTRSADLTAGGRGGKNGMDKCLLKGELCWPIS